MKLAFIRAISLPAIRLAAAEAADPFVVSVTCVLPLPLLSNVNEDEENVHPTSVGRGCWQANANVTFASDAPPAKLSEYTAG